LEHLELFSLDISFRLRGTIHHNPKINIIEISDYDIANIGRWPWKRTWHAAITRALSDMGARAIYFDMVFSEPSEENEDALFAMAIKESGRVYLPFAFQPPSLNIDDALLPIEPFAAGIKGTGAINIYPDSDGKLRRTPLVFLDQDKTYMHVVLKVIADNLGLELEQILPDGIVLAKGADRLKIPTIRRNQMLVNWTGRWEDTFKHYSFLQVIAAYQAMLENKEPAIGIADFKDSICLIGMTAIGLYDIKPVPIQPEYPGIGILANVISNILDGSFVREVSPWINILILYIMAALPSFLISGGNPFRETIAVLSAGFIFCLVNFFLFTNGIRIELFTPLLGLISSYVFVSVYNSVQISIERQNFFKMSVTDGLTGLFNIRYFKMLIETEIIIAKADPDKKFCVVMTDADHFKKFNDTYGHQVGDLVLKSISSVLKSSVRGMDIVARYGGEEMIILLRGSTLKDGLNVAEKIRHNIESCIVKNEAGNYKVMVSLGISRFKNDDTVDTIIKRADDALYKAKKNGRNRVETVETESATT